MGWLLLIIIFFCMFPQLILPLLAIYFIVAYAITLWPITLVALVIWIIYKCSSK